MIQSNSNFNATFKKTECDDKKMDNSMLFRRPFRLSKLKKFTCRLIFLAASGITHPTRYMLTHASRVNEDECEKW